MNATSLLQRGQASTSLIRSVSSVTFALMGEGAFERAINLSAKWMRNLNSAIPDNSTAEFVFDVGGGGNHPARAVAFDYSEGKIWSATIDNPDGNVLGRTWITEITVAKRHDEVHFGARLLNVTRRSDEPFVPSIPRLVRDIIDRSYCGADGVRISSAPTYIKSNEELEGLVALLQDPNRRLPVIVMAQAISRHPSVDLENLARRACGAAHVVGVDDSQSRNFRRYTSREIAVFDGSVRIFKQKLDFDNIDPYAHPIWIPNPSRTMQWNSDSIISRILISSVSKGTTDYPRFEAVRQASAERALTARRINSSDAEMVRLYEDENLTLKRDLENLRSEQNQWLADAEAERSISERQASELKAEIYRHKLQTAILRAAIKQSGGSITKEPLSDIGNFRDWSEKNISTNIWIAPKAIKEIERNGMYRSPEEIGEALFLLDDIYVPMRRDGITNGYAECTEKLAQLGMTISDCFANNGDLRRFPEYSVVYKDERLWCDMHLKCGGGTDPRSMFRIYFTWNEENGIVVIGHMPTHLDNNLTN